MNPFLVAVVLFLILFAFWRFVYFFRNPVRKSTAGDDAILSPADGYVLYVRYIQDPEEEVFSVKNERKILLHELMLLRRSDVQFTSGWLIGITMTPLDVHYNRAPVQGFISRIGYEFPTNLKRNLNMFPALQNLFFKKEKPFEDCSYLVHNERASYVITNNRLHLYVTQIADQYVKRIVTYKDHVSVSRGEVFGLIRMGSQVDVFIPDTELKVNVLIKPGQHVKAGIDSIAIMHPLNQFPVAEG
jgi:phosphatidylserine decarboxylase